MASAAILPVQGENLPVRTSLSNAFRQVEQIGQSSSHMKASTSSCQDEKRSKKSLHCPFDGCDKAFTKECKLEDHKRTHTGERPFRCEDPDCGKTFGRKDHLQRHMKTHSIKGLNTSTSVAEDVESIRPFVCTVNISSFKANGSNAGMQCSRRFLTKQHLIRHIKEMHDYSSSCDELGMLKDEYTTNMLEEDDKINKKRKRAPRVGMYACTIPGCEATFTKRKLLRAHINVYHSDLGKSIGSAREDEAERISRLPFPCTEPGCTKRYPTNAKRNAHIEQKHNHSNDRSYVCFHESHQGKDKLEARFATWSELQAHQREDHKPFCDECKKYFKDARNLRVHTQRYHFQLSEDDQDLEDSSHRPRADKTSHLFACGWLMEGKEDRKRCMQTFVSKYNRDLHVRTVHRNEKPFSCPHSGCQRKFTNKRALMRHQYKCSWLTPNSSENQSDADDSDNASVETEPAVQGGSDDEDNFFRREGGAVPESFADRPRAQKRKMDAVSDSIGILQHDEKDLSIKKPKRKIRGRILLCPWSKICRLRDEDDGEKEGHGGFETVCPFRFSRLYDVQRHLERKHGLALTQFNLSAFLDDEQKEVLGTPRKGTKLADQVTQSVLEEEDEKADDIPMKSNQAPQ